ncbi:MAG: hypothetical protein J3K34DRAFT_173507 [Monoraphidium minutum]|nr:MAG: hypothetical protein J3K34DRAFT_173507 [Monoraphidium minutum]
MLGKRYVAWFDRAAPSGGAWRLVDDACPHRLSPLSESRIRADGQLTCAYHGWSFDGSGACTNIPQLGDPKARATACASARTCVASYPTATEDGLLFAWLEAGPRGAAAAAADLAAKGGRLVVSEVAGRAARVVWASHEVPNDYLYWAEQGLDPSHANWLHHDEIGFYMDDATPMEAEAIPAAAIDPAAGFVWRHGEYRRQGKDVDATRTFRAPNCLITRYQYPNGGKQAFQIFVVPIVPGTCRIFFQEGRGQPRPRAAAGAAAVLGGREARAQPGGGGAGPRRDDHGGAGAHDGRAPPGAARLCHVCARGRGHPRTPQVGRGRRLRGHVAAQHGAARAGRRAGRGRGRDRGARARQVAAPHQGLRRVPEGVRRLPARLQGAAGGHRRPRRRRAARRRAGRARRGRDAARRGGRRAVRAAPPRLVGAVGVCEQPGALEAQGRPDARARPSAGDPAVSAARRRRRPDLSHAPSSRAGRC